MNTPIKSLRSASVVISMFLCSAATAGPGANMSWQKVTDFANSDFGEIELDQTHAVGVFTNGILEIQDISGGQYSEISLKRSDLYSARGLRYSIRLHQCESSGGRVSASVNIDMGTFVLDPGGDELSDVRQTGAHLNMFVQCDDPEQASCVQDEADGGTLFSEVFGQGQYASSSAKGEFDASQFSNVEVRFTPNALTTKFPGGVSRTVMQGKASRFTQPHTYFDFWMTIPLVGDAPCRVQLGDFYVLRSTDSIAGGEDNE